VSRFETICKKFSQAARRSINTLQIDEGEADRLMEIITKYGTTLLDLELEFWPKENNEADILWGALGRLTKLTFRHSWPYDSKLRLLNTTNDLRTLFLDGPISLSKLSGLRSLLIYNNIDTDVLCDDIASLTKLTQLLLTKVDGRLLETLANFSNIATLRLGFLASFANWNNLAMLTNVQALSMTENRLDLYLPALCQLSQLTSLSVSPALASKYSELTRISRLDRLERLLLEVQDVPAEVGQLTQLTQLETFFDGDTTKLVTKFQRLKVIKCLRVEGDLLRQLPKLPNLEKIVVPGIEMNSHFEELIACSKLTCLKIGCSDRLNIMTPEVASNLQLQMYERVAKLTTLKELEIDYYDNIEPLLVLTNLQSLRVYANYRRTPVEELAAIKRLPNLAKFFFDTIDTVLSAREIKQKLFSADSHVQVSVPRVYV
jgi:hypothetical protein